MDHMRGDRETRMRSIDETHLDVLLVPDRDDMERDVNVPSYYVGTREDRELLRRQSLALRTLREKLVDGLRRVWYGPDPGPLTDEEMRMIMRPREDEDDLPERVPPDDPGRLAWEAELRAMGVRPAKKWNFPRRAPIKRPSVWEKIKYRISLGW
jgi:hypothetical protein